MSKSVIIEYLFLELQTCDRCIGTAQVLDEVVETITPVLELAGYQVEYHKIEMTTARLAEEYRFLSSPTIRVNGQDICKAVKESECRCCSQISGTAVDCRVFKYEERVYEVPPKAMLVEAILRSVFTPNDAPRGNCYTLPDNLKTFFARKNSKNGSFCRSSGCC